jgi:hypothetical protein
VKTEVISMATLRGTQKTKKAKTRRGKSEGTVHMKSETDFKGPNARKRHRKPDELYGDTSIPDSARKE